MGYFAYSLTFIPLRVCSNCSFSQFNHKGVFISPASSTSSVPSPLPQIPKVLLKAAEEGTERCTAPVQRAWCLLAGSTLWLGYGKSTLCLQSSESWTPWTCQASAVGGCTPISIHGSLMLLQAKGCCITMLKSAVHSISTNCPILFSTHLCTWLSKPMER